MTKHKINTTELPYRKDSGYWFAKISQLPAPVFLQSADLQGTDIISAAPVASIVTHGESTRVTNPVECYESTADPFAILQEVLEQYLEVTYPVGQCKPVFGGGALGFFGYDLGRRIETLPGTPSADIGLPDMAVGIYLWSLETDHIRKTSTLFMSPDYPVDLANLITDALESSDKIPINSFKLRSALRSNFGRRSYRDAFLRIKQYITQGDCYQVNLAQRFSASFSGNSWHLYERISSEIQAPFSAYLAGDAWSVLSFSPERLLSIKNQQVLAQPIKGTRPRAADAGTDASLARELQRSGKDQAENLMIVDLIRNDLGKSCIPGSIRTPALFRLESFKNVHHLVSDVTGCLSADTSALDLLRGCFPGGSITGAPKIRAMQIIDELEPHRRSAYCGSIGYLGLDGSMDMNIAIRTLVCDNDKVHCWGGGGIVADSDCLEEYDETLDKINLLLNAMSKSSEDDAIDLSRC